MSDTLAGMPSVSFDAISIGANPYEGSDAQYVLSASVLSHSTTLASEIEAAWQTCLVDGAIAERLAGDATDLEQVIIAPHVQIRLPDGSTAHQGGCGGDVAPGELFAAQADGTTDSAIRASIEDVLLENGFTSREIVVSHPLGPAVRVIATTGNTDDLSERLHRVMSATYDSTDEPVYEGFYLEVRDGEGESLFVAATAFRAGTSFSHQSEQLGSEFGSSGGDPNNLSSSGDPGSSGPHH